MNTSTLTTLHIKIIFIFILTTFIFFRTTITPVHGQQSAVATNTKTVWAQPTFTNFHIDTSSSGYIGITQLFPPAYDTTRWTKNTFLQLTDANTSNATSLRLVAEGTLIPNPSPTIGIITLHNNATYSNNYIQVKLSITNTSSGLSNSYLDFTVLTSQNGINFDTVYNLSRKEDNGFIYLGGLAPGNYQYVRVYSHLRQGIALFRTCTINFHEISFNRLSNASVPCNSLHANTQPITSRINPFAELEVNTNRSGVIDGINIPIGVPAANLDRIIDQDTINFGSIATGVGINVGAQIAVSIKNHTQVYPAQSYLGYRLSTVNVLSLSILGNFQLVSYLNGVEQERVSGNDLGLNLGLLNASSKFNFGFITTKPANELQLVFTPGIVDIGGVQVYQLINKAYCEGPPAPCNQIVNYNQTNYPLEVSSKIRSAISIDVGTGVDSLLAVLDNNPNTAAKFVAAANVGVASTSEIVIKKALQPFVGVNYVGFSFQEPSIASINILGRLSLVAYYKGVKVDSLSGSNLISAGVPLLNGTGYKKLGLFLKDTFDEVRLKFENPIQVNVATVLHVYDFFVEQFCLDPNAVHPDSMVCNSYVPYSKPQYPLYIDYNHTGIKDQLIVVGDINNPHYALDNDATTHASIDIPINLSAAGASFCVANALDTYNIGTYVAFDIELLTLVDVAVIDNLTIELLLDNTVVQSQSGFQSLAGVNTGLLLGTGFQRRQSIGVVATSPFNKVVFRTGSLVGINLGSLNIYGVEINKLCATPINCNQSYILEKHTQPVLINYTKTGSTGLVAAGNAVVNAEHVIDSSRTNFASIATIANVAGGNSIAIHNPIQTYPKGSYAGFTISNGAIGLLDLGLLEVITISTYNNGVLSERKWGANLLHLDLLIPLIGPSNNAKTIGFITSQPFDEVVITVGGLASVATNIHVYGAFVDTRYAFVNGGTVCNFLTSPDFAISYKGITINGDVSTNDIVPIGTEYRTPVAHSGNPANATLNMQTNGNYTFSSTLTGTYYYTIPVCYIDSTDNNSAICKNEQLKITILDTTAYPNAVNRPAINSDLSTISKSLTGTDTVSIAVLSNDEPGNWNGQLDSSSLIILRAPLHGSAIVRNGQVHYIPTVNYTGTDTFWYRIWEQPSNTSDSAIVVVHVQENAIYPLFAVDDYYQIPGNKITSIDATIGLLVNDISLSGDSIKAIAHIQNIPSKGKITIEDNGSFIFEPSSGFYGPIQFSYQATDNTKTSHGTINILVSPDASQQWITSPDFAVTFIGSATEGTLALNDHLPSNATYVQVEAHQQNPSNTGLQVQSNGNFTFTNTNSGIYYYHTTTHFTYNYYGKNISERIKEQLKITVLDTSVTSNNKPIINPDAAILVGSPSATTSVNLNVMANDGKGNIGGSIQPLSVDVLVAPSHGTVAINNGIITYEAQANYFGIDSFYYHVTEQPSNLSDSALVKILVQPNNAASLLPVNDFKEIGANQNSAINALQGVLANDINLTATPMTVNPNSLTIPNKGSFQINMDGSYSFQPEQNYFGPVVVSYTVNNGTSPRNGLLHLLVSLPDEALRIHLKSFKVIESGCNTAQVNWEVNKESNVLRYELEQSIDGHKFTTLLNTKATNNSWNSAYQFKVYQPNNEAYYRLKIVEQDEKIYYSHIEKASIGCVLQEMQAVPNPTHGLVKITGTSTNSHLQLTDIKGSVLLQQTISDNSATVDLSNFASGMYIIIITDEHQRSSHFKIIKN